MAFHAAGWTGTALIGALAVLAVAGLTLMGTYAARAERHRQVPLAAEPARATPYCPDCPVNRAGWGSFVLRARLSAPCGSFRVRELFRATTGEWG
ncbi:hypothetical protein ACFQVA_13980 [Actinomadura keratinilytica]